MTVMRFLSFACCEVIPHLSSFWCSLYGTYPCKAGKGRVLAAIDSNSPEGRATGAAYEVTGYPTLIYFEYVLAWGTVWRAYYVWCVSGRENLVCTWCVMRMPVVLCDM